MPHLFAPVPFYAHSTSVPKPLYLKTLLAPHLRWHATSKLLFKPMRMRANMKTATKSFCLAFLFKVSEDFSTWVSLCTNVVTDGALRYLDPEALQHSRRFYRIVPQSNYVPEE